MEFIPYLVVIPLGSAFLITLLGKRVRAAGSLVSCLAAFALACISFILASGVIAQGPPFVYKVGHWLPPAGITLVIDSLAAFMLVTVNVVSLLILVYSSDYVKKYTDEWKFYALFMLMLTGINGVLAAGDIFNLYVFLEIGAIAAYFLVAFGIEAEELEAAFKYAVMGSVASIFILLGIAFLYSFTSTLNMADMASVLSSCAPGASAKVVQFTSVLFLMGFGLKAALFPFHAWLPYAHSAAPAPVSAMLSGILIKVLGIYALARIFFNVFGLSSAVSSVLIFLAVFSMIVGSILAFGQSDIKRLFAYSSISQIGYIALALGIGTPLAVTGALFYLLAHSVSKSLLFLTSGAIERIAGTRDLGRIRGISAREPVTGYSTLIASLSVCGVPPLAGFWGKLIIIIACFQAGHRFLAFIAIAVSILTLAYYFKALTPALFGQDEMSESRQNRTRLSLSFIAPMLILAVLTVACAWLLVPGPGNTLLRNAAGVLTGGVDYAGIITGGLR